MEGKVTQAEDHPDPNPTTYFVTWGGRAEQHLYGFYSQDLRVLRDYSKSFLQRHAVARDNPLSGGAVALAALAVAGVAWLFLRPKEAAAATSPAAFTKDLELPSLVPSTTPTATPAPAKIVPGPALPQLNCAGKVFVTYKFKDAPSVINVFRRLTTWPQGQTPDQGTSFEERNWALSGTTSFFNIGVLDAQGWLNTTSLENHHKDAQVQFVTKRYLAEAWVETTDGWCLAATDTNYEPWV